MLSRIDVEVLVVSACSSFPKISTSFCKGSRFLINLIAFDRGLASVALKGIIFPSRPTVSLKGMNLPTFYKREDFLSLGLLADYRPGDESTGSVKGSRPKSVYSNELFNLWPTGIGAVFWGTSRSSHELDLELPAESSYIRCKSDLALFYRRSCSRIET